MKSCKSGVPFEIQQILDRKKEKGEELVFANKTYTVVASTLVAPGKHLTFARLQFNTIKKR